MGDNSFYMVLLIIFEPYSVICLFRKVEEEARRSSGT